MHARRHGSFGACYCIRRGNITTSSSSSLTSPRRRRPRPRPSSETKSRVTNRSSRGGPALLARNQNMDRCGVPLQLVAEVHHLGPSEGGYFVSFSARLWSLVSLLHHAFLWQNSADWQGMNDARCFGTDPSLPPSFSPGGGAAISMMRRHKMGTASAARAAQTASGN